MADSNGATISTSRARLEGGFQDAGFPRSPTRSPGMEYTLPDGSLVRIMEPSGQAPLRASFTDQYGNAINPFTGKQPQPPPGIGGAGWRQMMRERTRIWDLCGLSIISVVEQSPRMAGDPAFELSDGRWLEIFSDHPVDPWSFRLPEVTFVGSPSDPSQTGIS